MLNDGAGRVGTALHTETAFVLVADMLDCLLLGATESEEEAEAVAGGLVRCCLEELAEIAHGPSDAEVQAAEVYGLMRSLQCVLLRTGRICADTWAQILESRLHEWHRPPQGIMDSLDRAQKAVGHELMVWVRQYLQSDGLLSDELDRLLLPLQQPENTVRMIVNYQNTYGTYTEGNSYSHSTHHDQSRTLSLSPPGPAE